MVEQAEAIKQAVTDTSKAEVEARAAYLAAKDFTKAAKKIISDPPSMVSGSARTPFCGDLLTLERVGSERDEMHSESSV